MPLKYRKVSGVSVVEELFGPDVEALQLTLFTIESCEEFIGGDMGKDADGDIVFATLDGALKVKMYDFIVKDSNGKFSSCNPALFAATYMQVE